MKTRHFAFAIVAALVLSGCARLQNGMPEPNFGPQRSSASTQQQSGLQSPMQTQDQQAVASTSGSQAAAASGANISTFVDSSTVAKLSAKEKTEASSAQFYALQYGRPGAPRSWSGDTGASGEVTVGPYVRVNSRDCRDYTHRVTVDGQTYESEGTACREANGTWTVASTAS